MKSIRKLVKTDFLFLCQNTILYGFAPISKNPEELSKAMENYTVQKGSINYGRRYENIFRLGGEG